jgi:hypothetical protein
MGVDESLRFRDESSTIHESYNSFLLKDGGGGMNGRVPG